MRVSKEQAADNRRQLLAAAANLFRENGIQATGVDEITRHAGLTHGSLYSQFGCKEAVAAEAILYAASRSRDVWQGVQEHQRGKRSFRKIVEQYLSRPHRDARGRGCVLAALGTDMSRQPARVRQAFTKALKAAFAFVADQLPGPRTARREDQAIAAFCCMAGALILARAVEDAALSDRILDASAKQVVRLASPLRRN